MLDSFTYIERYSTLQLMKIETNQAMKNGDIFPSWIARIKIHNVDNLWLSNWNS